MSDTGSAAFQKAYKFTLKFEGGYVNNPDDIGKETIKGISRVYWPQWKGWEVVDAAKKESGFPRSLNSNESLDDEIKKFYIENFWNPLRCEDLAARSLPIAAEVFDAGVNMGKTRSAKFLQTALNIFNRKGSLYSDLVVDGKPGNVTIRSYNILLASCDPELVLKTLLIQRGAHYIKRALEEESQETFIRGWINRIVIDKGL
jgi:lysozyme family protein